MANIKISNLSPVGSDLFSDSESYINELGDGEISSIQGGFSSWKCVGWSARFSIVGSIVASLVVTTAEFNPAY
jgi:hypothetical protein